MPNRLMPADLTLSTEGADVLADREGCELEAYLDTRGILTIGIGHTSAAGPPTVYEDMVITEEEAHQIFRNDNARFRDECVHLVTAPVTQYEFDALASFIFNLGSTQFASSTTLTRLNASDYVGAAEAMLWWDEPPEVRSRRQGEYVQFTTGQYIARVEV